MSLLEAQDVTVYYGPRCAVDHLCLAVGAGEVVGLLGPNGAGKTTTFRVLAGLLDSGGPGKVLLDGRTLRGPLHHRVRAGLGYLPQESSLLDGMSALDQVGVALTARGESAQHAWGYLEQVGLRDRSAAVPNELSGGERRRLELARCLAVKPEVLLLDEPFAGLDPRGVSELSGLIRELAGQGLGVLLTDHAVREALEVCDRVLLLDEGRVLVEGAVADVAVHPLARSRWLGEDFQLGALK